MFISVIAKAFISFCSTSLHIMVNNFELAEIMTEAWLNYSKNKDNLYDYLAVADNYVVNILTPTRQFRKLNQFVKDNEAILDRNRVEACCTCTVLILLTIVTEHLL